MAYYAIAPLLCTLMHNELYMHLYTTEIYNGPNSSNDHALVINVNPPLGFGNVVVDDWPVTDGLGPNANIVGHIQGVHIQSSQNAAYGWYFSFNLDFEGTRFGGSMLRVMGMTAGYGDWSIIGGAGEFTMARGVVENQVVQEDSGFWRTYELKIHAFYTPMNSSVVSSIAFTKNL
ncbi:hypothetical protein HU200_034509 [Digitaria exilis]|uniref:Dirigent protein n=1 Tax=Digitaria exilis TaxID=1010633 RepID=A0A835EQD1_9POAL|nr:hypothetical protein HU200_034509 [Digitaria exilis]